MRHEQQYLSFRLRGVRYGIPLGACQEVSLRFRINPVPRARPYLAGIMNLRGEVVTVVDLGLLLVPDGKQCEGGAVIRLKSKEQSVAFQVDRIEDIVTADAELAPPPPHLSEAHLKLMAGVLQRPDGVVQIVSPAGILNV